MFILQEVTQNGIHMLYGSIFISSKLHTVSTLNIKLSKHSGGL